MKKIFNIPVYNMPKSRCSGSGSYGKYYKINKKTGVKIFKEDDLKSVFKEKRLLDRASQFNISPRCFGLGIFIDKKNNDVKLGLIVEHIFGIKNIWDNKKDKKRKAITTEAYSNLLKIGIKNDDVTLDNIIFKKDGTYKVIDFTAEQCHVNKKLFNKKKIKLDNFSKIR